MQIGASVKPKIVKTDWLDRLGLPREVCQRIRSLPWQYQEPMAALASKQRKPQWPLLCRRVKFPNGHVIEVPLLINRQTGWPASYVMDRVAQDHQKQMSQKERSANV